MSDELESRRFHSRAVEALIWGMPLVNYRLMYDAAVRAGMSPGSNETVLWPGRLDWHNQTLTPNPDVVYLMPFFDTSSGPVVLEVPAAEGGAINGSVMDCWQAAIEDVGVAGVDQGAGGRYVVLPPGYDAPVPDGFVPLPSPTVRGYALLRSVPTGGSEAEIAAAVDYARRVRVYPLGADASESRFVEVADETFEASIPYDSRFYEVLHAALQDEPWLERDRALIDTLATLGIARGGDFDPDGATRAALDAAAAEAHALLDERYVRVITPFADGARWGLPAQPVLVRAVGAGFAEPESYPVDARGLTYTFAFFSARHLGTGQFYLMTVADADGNPLDGAHTYELVVPRDAPVKQYWSATLYDRDTHTLLQGLDRSGVSSQTAGLVVSDDGATRLRIGPTAPEQDAANWAPTDPTRPFEVLFRLYGPTPAFFDKTWRLPDLVRVG